VARLKARARQHIRSLQGGLKTILEAALAAAGAPSSKFGRRQLKVHIVNIPTRATRSLTPSEAVPQIVKKGQ